jgi:heme-degrading monooxygenase HmoA
MIARVTWGKIKPGKWGEFERLWQDYAKASADVPGARGRLLLKDGATADAGYGISFWDDEAAFEAFSTSPPPQDEMRDCFVGEHVTTVTKVSGSTIAGLL